MPGIGECSRKRNFVVDVARSPTNQLHGCLNRARDTQTRVSVAHKPGFDRTCYPRSICLYAAVVRAQGARLPYGHLGLVQPMHPLENASS
ncbi:hypothetical protein WS98_23065 [Burkholderia territorii]|nr:hypothetical protein WS98_23065 [Burkholderia territorii]